MVDPVSIIGTAGAVANIIEVLGKTIGTCYDVYQQWREADYTLTNLIAQLTALKAALTKIEEWSDAESGDQHHQLVIDLDICLTCVRRLVTGLDSEVSGLRVEDDGSLAATGRVSLVLGTSKIQELQKSIETQTSALLLLLTACNSKSLADQKALLEKRRTRKTIERVQKDTESLLVLRDDGSYRTRATDTGSKLSITFAFDRQLLLTNVYEKVIRQSVKNAIRSSKKPQAQSDIVTNPTADPRCKILLLGVSESGKSTVIKQINTLYGGGYTEKEKHIYRPNIYNNVLTSAQMMVEAIGDANIQLGAADTQACCDIIAQSNYPPGPPPMDQNSAPPFDKHVGQAISNFWKDPCIPQIMDHAKDLSFMDAVRYHIDNVDRIIAPDYVPTELDIYMARQRTTGITEHVCSIDGMAMSFFDVGGARSERKKWIHVFEGVTAVLFMVDAGHYDRLLLEDSLHTRIDETLMLFESIVTSRWFAKSEFFVLFNKMDEFERTLAKSPLEKYFPDYPHSGDGDVEKAKDYLVQKFEQLNVSGVNVHPHFTQSNESEKMRVVLQAVKEQIVKNVTEGQRWS